jgi:hygromycin-B 4-O-kinase
VRPPALGPDVVAAFLAEELGGPVTDVVMLDAGAWSRPVAFRRAGRPLIARFSSVADDFRNDERAAAFASLALPVPPIHAIGRAFGGWYAISGRVEGDYLETADEPTMNARLPSLFAALDSMRAVDLSGTTGFGGWDQDGNGPQPSWAAALLAIAEDVPARRIAGWRARLGQRPDVERVFARAFAKLERLAPDLPDARHVVHSDLLNRNVLVARHRITAVLDWGSAMYGDFLFDLAWFRFWGPWYEGWGRLDVVAAARRHHQAIGLVVPDLELRMRACELFIALDGLSYLAWAGFETAMDWTTRRTTELLAGSR